ncbi:hypothetical protein MLN87_07360 [Escherichia coli]|nr:hypothetical protein [Escherichia coli]MCN8204081.1 hypothetical protein [Escherichia coli]HAI3384503.1 hypothetical protein [Escherichia coli]HAL0004641.1 hypothetical protein [Escherichia coli]HAP1523983.1 hypothetical protein [Escherichia coli]
MFSISALIEVIRNAQVDRADLKAAFDLISNADFSNPVALRVIRDAVVSNDAFILDMVTELQNRIETEGEITANQIVIINDLTESERAYRETAE